jgi:hypothetical protein
MTLTADTQDGSPLTNFDKLLFLAIEKKSAPLFAHLQQKYQPVLNRDKEFEGVMLISTI